MSALASDRSGWDLQLGCLRASYIDSMSHSFLTCEMGVTLLFMAFANWEPSMR